ncbi:MAG: ECF transporter S component [Eubacteriales bacterium]|nr:ECF transporter S component [Eubacteriales bacterium]
MNKNIRNLTISGFMLALGLVLPFLTGQIPQIGRALLPMHLPVFLCALICGWKYGLLVGAVMPLLRHLLFTMPPFQVAIAMTFEMATYGLVAGYIYFKMKKSNPLAAVYTALVSAMILGRIVWGIAQMILMGVQGNPFGFQAFLGGALFSAIPGIILQLVLVPALILLLEKNGVIRRGE